MNTHRYSVRFSVATRVKWIVTAILVVAAYVVWTEYKGQGAELLPYLFLLACPLMHLFHHGHGSHAHHHQRRRQRTRKRCRQPLSRQFIQNLTSSTVYNNMPQEGS